MSRKVIVGFRFQTVPDELFCVQKWGCAFKYSSFYSILAINVGNTPYKRGQNRPFGTVCLLNPTY